MKIKCDSCAISTKADVIIQSLDTEQKPRYICRDHLTLFMETWIEHYDRPSDSQSWEITRLEITKEV